ncbi:hypothetical protein KFK09_015689 [Dendrobium nobile]|uniref:Retrovirus-related Pol polyprotein from transposon TNT 1-94 n=1 Tax=Dendrobium nobile TaxID=94219 RepID=A0A8T3BB85_DENNO|nr:hypothetical protein KFK09_015689 [Dendrobium nobile]
MPSSNTAYASPFELLYNTKPQYTHLRTFGCACFPLIPTHDRHKLQPKTKTRVFLGYSDKYKGYKCLEISTNKITISRHLTFDELFFPFSGSAIPTPQPTHTPPPALLIPHSVTQQLPQTKPVLQHVLPQTQITSVMPPVEASPRNPPSLSSTRAPTPDPHLPHQHSMVTRSKTGSIKPTVRLNLFHHTQSSALPPDPSCYTEAVKKIEWRKAMSEEFLALQKQGTWTLVPPPDSGVLGCKWTYRTKIHADGSIAKYKARLVALGNNQEFGTDYTETFSPVAKLPTIRILLAIAIQHDWPVQQLDVANAFLHGHLQETVHMKQPRGFEDPIHPNYVCRLHKSLYGLKQAPRQWYNTFTEQLLLLGFINSKSDPSLFIFKNNNAQIFLLIYVDDILITGSNQSLIHEFINQLGSKFTLKHLGEVNNFLGIQITRNAQQFFLSHHSYATSILQQAQLQQCNPIANP